MFRLRLCVVLVDLFVSVIYSIVLIWAFSLFGWVLCFCFLVDSFCFVGFGDNLVISLLDWLYVIWFAFGGCAFGCLLLVVGC